ncbi:33079_t:CDS:1, partial [Racocetra persica]
IYEENKNNSQNRNTNFKKRNKVYLKVKHESNTAQTEKLIPERQVKPA